MAIQHAGFVESRESVMTVTRHFMGWEEDAVSCAVACLTEGWETGNLDLRHRLVVVPTRNAGRRLRERLAEYAAEKAGAVIPGRVVTPEYLVTDHANRYAPYTASSSEVIGVWLDLFQQLDLDDYPALFSQTAENSGQEWAWTMTEHLISLRRLLSEAGLSLSSVSEEWRENPEPNRWRDLAALEKKYLDELAAYELYDPEQVKMWMAESPAIPAEVDKVDVFAVPDPLPLAVTALDRIASSGCAVEVHIHAPEYLSDAFDDFGRPLADYWQNRSIEIPNGEENILVASGPQDQAVRAAEVLNVNGLQADNVAVGVPDDEVVPHLEKELQQRGMVAYDPSGETLEAHPITQFVDQAADLVSTGDYTAFSNLMRHPDVLVYFEQHFSDFDASEFLRKLDDFQNRHMPRTYEDFKWLLARHLEHADQCRQVVNLADEQLIRPVTEGTSPVRGLIDMLRRVYAQRELYPHGDSSHSRSPQHLAARSETEDKAFAEAAEHVSSVAQELRSRLFEEKFEFDTATLMSLFRRQLRSKRIFNERSPDAVDLQGWLELQWDDASCVLVTGMNEGRVPETVVGDPFLPDSARTKLGIKNNRQRFARDAYMLRALLESRRQHGAVTLVTGKTTEREDPLKPSRLFFLCDDATLVERVKHLFGEVSKASTPVGTNTRWRFQPFGARTPDSLSVTALSSFLQCRFRFYLRHVLQMEALDDRKHELDAMDFGGVVHSVLQELENYQSCTDSGVIATGLSDALDRLVAELYGRRLSAAIGMQVESARQRLYAAARKHAELNAAGWRTIAAERDVQTEIEGVRLRGRVDRIDKHPDGRIRILDYKTSEKAKVPNEVQWTAVQPHAPDYARITVGTQEKQWADLQLPLYAYLLREEFPDAYIECGYFNLPKAVAETDIALWEKNSEWSYVEAALTCAKSIIRDVKAGNFWPPAKPPPYDDFEKLFLENPEDAFEV